MSIYTVQRILASRGEKWALARLEHQGDVVVAAGVWPSGVPIPGQKFKGALVEQARGKRLDQITDAAVDENAFRNILHRAGVNRTCSDALFKNGMKRLKTALAKGSAQAFRRWKGVGKSTAQAALDAFPEFIDTFSFRDAWFETYPTLAEKYNTGFDAILRASKPGEWKEPYRRLIKSKKFWGYSLDEEDGQASKLAAVIAQDVGSGGRWKELYDASERIMQALQSSGSTYVKQAVEVSDESPITCDDASRASLAIYEEAEQYVAKRVAQMCTTASLRPCARLEGLDDAQSQAVVQAVEDWGVSVLCGGAGVGKSRTLVKLIAYAKQYGYTPLVVAPTGKAALRLMELGTEARTVHAAMFGKNDKYDMIVLDEQSMQDITVLAAFLKMLPRVGKIVFVGDPFQLPSVGPGALLRDLLAEKRIPRVRLTTIYRQEGGSIVENANLIRRGNSSLTRDASFDVRPYSESAVVEAYLRAPGAVIIAPLNRTVAALNTQVARRLYRSGAHVKVKLYGYRELWKFYVGDKVMNVKNVREEGVFVANGSVGEIRSIAGEKVRVQFETGVLEWASLGEVQKHLRPCYAITVHKSQGSEYDTVLCVVEPTRLMHRQTLYTAVTRAKRRCVLFETPGGVRRAISSRAPVRHTRLQEYLNTCFSRTTTPPLPSSAPPTEPATTPLGRAQPSAPTSRTSSKRVGAWTPTRGSISPTRIGNSSASCVVPYAASGARPTASPSSSHRSPCAVPTCEARSSTKRSMASPPTGTVHVSVKRKITHS